MPKGNFPQAKAVQTAQAQTKCQRCLFPKKKGLCTNPGCAGDSAQEALK